MFVRLFILFILSTVFSCCCIYAQPNYNQQENFLKRNSVWVFGEHAGLDLNGPAPVALQTAINAYEACASVADSAGELLFYIGSDSTVYNRNHTAMLNGTGMYPNHYNTNSSSSAQGARIIPVIDTPWKYYVFYNTQFESYATPVPPFLTYSVIDMSLDNGLGGVEPGRKNVPLYNYGLHEGMIAVPGENCDIWLITLSSRYYNLLVTDPALPDQDLQYILAWHITHDGIDPNPVMSNPYPGLSEHASFGNKFSVSPNREYIALGLWGGVLLCRFDPLTGILSDGISLPGRRKYSVCFSPDNTKLYGGSATVVSGITQYDISIYDSATIMASQYHVSDSFSCGDLRLYDDTIYAGQLNGSFLSRINDPNAGGAACNFQQGVIPLLPGTKFRLGFPTEVVFPPVAHESFRVYDTLCYQEDHYTPKVLSAPPGFSYYEWDNGLSDSGRQITAPGIYWVNYYNSVCLRNTDTFIVESLDLGFSLGEDTLLAFCDHPNAFLQLNVDLPYDNIDYLWQDNSKSNYYRVERAGTYWVEVSKAGCKAADTIHISGLNARSVAFNVSDTLICMGEPVNIVLHTPDSLPAGTVIRWSTGSADSSIHITDTGLYWLNLINPPCIFSDSIRITKDYCECLVNIPNAFTPNGDGINDQFLPVLISACLPLGGYALNIYNRFGQRVFHSPDYRNGWKGLYKGAPADAGVYFYDIRYTDSRGKQFYHKGDITLIR